MLIIKVQWYGPHTFEQACQEKKFGLYMVHGRMSTGTNPKQKKLLYCGISENQNGVGQRISQHECEIFNHRSNLWWVGRLSFPQRHSRNYLEAAEWMIIHFCGTECNIKKAMNPPQSETVLINEWFKLNGDRRRRNIDVLKKIQDVLIWSPELRQIAGGNLSVSEYQG